MCRAPRWARRLSVERSPPFEVSLHRILIALAAAEAGSLPEIVDARYIEAIVIGQGYFYDKAPPGQPAWEDASARSMLNSPHECHYRCSLPVLWLKLDGVEVVWRGLRRL